MVADRNRYLLFLFLFYIAALFGFAGIYYHIYLRDSRSFAFNSDIRASQGDDYSMWAERELADKSAVIALLHRLSELHSQKDNPPPSSGFWKPSITFVTSEYQCMFESVGGAAGGGIVDHHIRLTVKDIHGKEIRVIRLPDEGFVKYPDDLDGARKVIVGLISYYERQNSEVRRRLDTLTGSYPEIWSYWDFLYFSAITQTSVGYGDILPNSTKVRVVVVAHLLLSTIMLVLLINLAFPSVQDAIKSAGEDMGGAYLGQEKTKEDRGEMKADKNK